MLLKNVCVVPAKLGRNTLENVILNINRTTVVITIAASPETIIVADLRKPDPAANAADLRKHVPVVIAADLAANLKPDPAVIAAARVALVAVEASARADPSAARSVR